MTDIVRSLEMLGGVGRRAHLLQAGVTRTEIDRAISTGAVIRVRQGVYALPDVDSAVLTAAHHGGEVACSEALLAHKVWVFPEDASAQDPAGEGSATASIPPGDGRQGEQPDTGPHVWIGPSGREHAHAGCRCRVHHEVGDRAAGFGVVEVLLALLQYATCGTPEAFFAALESAMRLGLVGRTGIATLRARVSGSMRWLVDFASDQADSGLESLLRLRLHLRGISLRSQVDIPGVGRVDFLLAGCIILEADGKENHDGIQKRHKDLMRDAAAAAQGYETLRFDYAMILFHWDRVIAAIEGRLAALQSSRMQDGAAHMQER